jgi:hypothetical protein
MIIPLGRPWDDLGTTFTKGRPSTFERFLGGKSTFFFSLGRLGRPFIILIEIKKFINYKTIPSN